MKLTCNFFLFDYFQNSVTVFTMASAPTVKLKWLEHMNAAWVVEDCEIVGSREGVTQLYDRLNSSQEVVVMPQQVGVSCGSHTGVTWRSRGVGSREGVTQLYDRLNSSQEVVVMPQQVGVSHRGHVEVTRSRESSGGDGAV